MLEVRLAGGLQLRADGAELAPPASRRARARARVPRAQPGPQPRGQLAARFWPDVLDESARASLRVALTELRQALGPAAATWSPLGRRSRSTGPGLAVDTREFERRSTTAIPCAALEACAAPILDGFDDDWAYEAREAHAHRLARGARAGRRRGRAIRPRPSA